jgi:hypothetical protein
LPNSTQLSEDGVTTKGDNAVKKPSQNVTTSLISNSEGGQVAQSLRAEAKEELPKNGRKSVVETGSLPRKMGNTV